MSNVYTLNNIKDREDPKRVGYRLSSIRELELENALHSSIKSASDLANEYKDLQGVYLKQEKELELAFHTEIQSLKSEIKTLKRKVTLAQKASSLDKNEILCLKTEIDNLKAEVKELESEMKLECTFHDSDTTSFRDKISELNSLNHILEQERDDLNLKKHELVAKIGCKDSEIISLEAKVDELEKEKESLSQETNIYLAEQISEASSEFNEMIEGDSRLEKVIYNGESSYQDVFKIADRYTDDVKGASMVIDSYLRKGEFVVFDLSRSEDDLLAIRLRFDTLLNLQKEIEVRQKHKEKSVLPNE
ncbi:22727_t:CDS:2 [Cetraspora pellucida]|uniref:22727_t:CDS:1 n=1 Tax=Cetraspora pellucida TaxID=1433469 RepID=A0A9N9ABM5_9GLOM|nr:22727_t:CDS:2 [Cetraspora pellucida]